jgi:hypothetical protein
MVGIILVILTTQIFSQDQDYEKVMTEYSEKFLSYSQVFVKYASQRVYTETEYAAALVVSDVAEDFYQHTSYLGDYLLILKILKKQEKQRELVERLLKLRLESVTLECDAEMNKIKKAIQNVKDESITKTANSLIEDLTDLRGVFEKIHDMYQKEE